MAKPTQNNSSHYHDLPFPANDLPKIEMFEVNWRSILSDTKKVIGILLLIILTINIGLFFTFDSYAAMSIDYIDSDPNAGGSIWIGNDINIDITVDVTCGYSNYNYIYMYYKFNTGSWQVKTLQTCGNNIDWDEDINANDGGTFYYYIKIKSHRYIPALGINEYPTQTSSTYSITVNEPNYAPTIDSFTRTTTTLSPGANVWFEASWHDDNFGDSVSGYLQKYDGSTGIWSTVDTFYSSGGDMVAYVPSSYNFWQQSVSVRLLIGDGSVWTNTGSHMYTISDDITAPSNPTITNHGRATIKDGWDLSGTVYEIHSGITEARVWLYEKIGGSWEYINYYYNPTMTYLGTGNWEFDFNVPKTLFYYNEEWRARVRYYDGDGNYATSPYTYSDQSNDVLDDDDPDASTITTVTSLNNLSPAVYNITISDYDQGDRESSIYEVLIQYKDPASSNWITESNTPIRISGDEDIGVYQGQLSATPGGTTYNIRFYFRDYEGNWVASETITETSIDLVPPTYGSSTKFLDSENDLYDVYLYDVSDDTLRPTVTLHYSLYDDITSNWGGWIDTVMTWDAIGNGYFDYTGQMLNIDINQRVKYYMTVEDASNAVTTSLVDFIRPEDVPPEGMVVNINYPLNTIKQGMAPIFDVEASDEHSGVDHVKLYYCIDDLYSSCNNQVLGDYNYITDSTGTDGIYNLALPTLTEYNSEVYFFFGVFDNFNNYLFFDGEADSPSSFTVLDGELPNNPSGISTNPSTVVADSGFSIIWSATDDESGIDPTSASIEYYLDPNFVFEVSSASISYSSGQFTANILPKPAGVFHYKLSYSDNNGNEYTDPTYRYFTIYESTPPNVYDVVVNGISDGSGDFEVKTNQAFDISIDLADANAITYAKLYVYSSSGDIIGTSSAYVDMDLVTTNTENTQRTYKYSLPAHDFSEHGETITFVIEYSDEYNNIGSFTDTYLLIDGEPPDGSYLQAIYTGQPGDDYATFLVQDNVGIDPYTTSNIYVEFYDSENSVWIDAISYEFEDVEPDHQSYLVRAYMPSGFISDTGIQITSRITLVDDNENEAEYSATRYSIDGVPPYAEIDESFIRSTDGTTGYTPNQDFEIFLRLNDDHIGLDFNDIVNNIWVGVSAYVYDGFLPQNFELVCDQYNEAETPITEGTSEQAFNLEPLAGNYYGLPCRPNWNSPIAANSYRYVVENNIDYIAAYFDVPDNTARLYDNALTWGENSVLHFDVSFSDIAGNVGNQVKLSQGIGSMFEAGDYVEPTMNFLQNPYDDNTVFNNVDNNIIELEIGSFFEPDAITGVLEFEYYNPFAKTDTFSGWTIMNTITISNDVGEHPGNYNFFYNLGVFEVGSIVKYRITIQDQNPGAPNIVQTQWYEFTVTVDAKPPEPNQIEIISADNSQDSQFRIRVEDNAPDGNLVELGLISQSDGTWSETVVDIPKILYQDFVYYGYYETLFTLDRRAFGTIVDHYLHVEDSAGNFDNIMNFFDNLIIADNIPPTIGLPEFLNDPNNAEKTHLRIGATALDAEWSGVAMESMRLEYRLDPTSSWLLVTDGGVMLDNGYNMSISGYIPTQPNEQIVYYRATATDLSGNTAYYENEFTIGDDTAPIIELTSVADGGDLAPSVFDLSFEDHHSGLYLITAEYYANGIYQDDFILSKFDDFTPTASLSLSIPVFVSDTFIEVVIRAMDMDNNTNIFNFDYIISQESGLQISSVMFRNQYFIGEADTTIVGNESLYVPYSNNFNDPVVIATPIFNSNTTVSGTNQSQVIMVHDVNSTGFYLTFSSTSGNISEIEPVEVAFIAMESGQYYIGDMFVEVDSFSYTGSNQTQSYHRNLNSTSQILHATQSKNGGSIVQSRVINSNDTTFEVKVDVDNNSNHSSSGEEIGYIAISTGYDDQSGMMSGSALINNSISTVYSDSYLLDPVSVVSVNSNFNDTSVTAATYMTGDTNLNISLVENPQSDGLHINESVSFLTVGRGNIYASRSNNSNALIEINVSSSLDIAVSELRYQVDGSNWITIYLSNPFVSSINRFTTLLPDFEIGQTISIEIYMVNSYGSSDIYYLAYTSV